MFIFLLFFCTLVQNAPLEEGEKTDKKLVVIMLDGTRWDYFSSRPQLHPGYSKIKSEGVIAKYVQPILPANSYPSWTTIVTG